MHPCRSSELAVVIIPAQHVLDGAGAARVVGLEISTLKRFGWRVVLVVVAPGFKLRQTSRARWFEEVKKAAKYRFDVEVVLITGRVRPFRAWLSILFVMKAKFWNQWDMATDLALSNLLDVRQVQQLPNLRDAVVVCNYLSGVAVADALASRDHQVLVLHDLPPQRLSVGIARELRARPNLIALSNSDAERVELEVSGTICHVGVPFGGCKPLDFTDLLGYVKLTDAFAAARPAPTLNWSQSRLDSTLTLDLLFVGGAHRPNIEGLACFVENCFLPYLEPKGVNLVVAGDAGPALWGGRETPRGVFSIGRVECLRPLYAAAKLIIVPLLSGTGVSIKTVEAISLGKSVLSSIIGLRGLANSQSCGLTPPFDWRWAERIEQLLSSRQERRRLRSALHACSYVETLGSALEHSVQSMPGLTGTSRLHTAPASELEDYPLVEWVGDLREIIAVLVDTSLLRLERKSRLEAMLGERGIGCRDTCEELAAELIDATDRLEFALSVGKIRDGFLGTKFE